MYYDGGFFCYAKSGKIASLFVSTLLSPCNELIYLGCTLKKPKSASKEVAANGTDSASVDGDEV